MQDFVTGKALLSTALHQLICFLKKNRKAARIMKIAGILLMAVCLQVSARGLTQTVTISVKEAPLITILKEIKKQTGVTFFADNEQLGKAKKISITAKNLPLLQVLDLCFKDQPLTYTIIGNVINVVPRAEKTSKENSISQVLGGNIKGRIVDSKGEPISNATVTVKGTNKSTSTNANGEFSLAGVNDDAVIVITHVQYETQTIALHGNELVSATMQIKVTSLDDLQVIAYGTTTKRLATGNVVSVKSSDIEKQVINNPLLALEGKVPGLFITQNAGTPGTGVTVRIQGQNSLSKGSDPFYVIDGVPYTQQLMPNIGSVSSNIWGISGGSPLSYINPSDIESITVLKDADATSIYGSRAAAGAILITTKKGKAGKTKVDVNAQTGWGKVSHFLPLLNTEQYLEMRKEGFVNDGLTLPNISTSPNDVNYDVNGFWDQTKYTDWQKVLIGGTAKYNDVQASISGGNANTTFLIGSGYHKETTVFPGDLSDQKGSFHININNVSNNQKFRSQFSASYMVDNNNLIGTDLTAQAIKLSPNAPDLYQSDGSLNWAQLPNGNSTWFNPLSYLQRKFNDKSKNLVANALIEYEIAKGLSVKSSFGYTNMHSDQYSISPQAALAPEKRAASKGSSTFANTNITTWIVEPQAAYHTNLLNGKLEALAGVTISKEERNNMILAGTNYSSDLLLTDITSAGSFLAPIASSPSVYRYNAGFGRINYNYLNKYILNLSARRDGSSRFGSDNLFHNFYSVAGAWIFSEESLFRKLPALSFGKLKVSYGTTGNDQIGDYQFLYLYNSLSVAQPYGGVAALTPGGLPNPLLQWEETRKLNLGLDLGFFQDRVSLTVNYYLNRSSNQLQFYSLPFITGRSTIQRNFPATIQNNGWEIALNTTNIQSRNFTWKTSFNLTVPKNQLVSYPDLTTSTVATQYIVGAPITIQREYHFLGVDPSNGMYLFADQHGTASSGTLIDSAKTRYLNTSPTIYGGLENVIQFKGFELSVLFQFTKQYKRNYAFGDKPGLFSTNSSGSLGTNNQPNWVMDRWQKPGDNATLQRFSSSYPAALRTLTNNLLVSDINAPDASYIRLRNISLSWQIPKEWREKIHFQNARIYVQGQNILTITNYKGMNPETGTGGLPPLRIITAGMQIGL
jgi:TonB-linked SusC/RagA family outer membrane protein